MLMVSVVVGATLTAVYIRERINLTERMAHERTSALEKLARISESTLDAREERILLAYLDSWMKSDEVLDVALWDLDGRVHIHSDFLKKDYSKVVSPKRDPFVERANRAEGIRAEPVVQDGKKVLLMAVPVWSEGKRFGSTVVRYNRGVIDRELAATLKATLKELFAVGGVCLALSLLVSFFFASNLTRPIRALSEAARQIGVGKFDADIPVQRKDELGTLAGDLNRMARQLKEVDELKDRFLQSVSHNMRSPLSAITGAAYHAHQLSHQVPETIQEDIRIIDLGVKELTRFVNNLLDLERIRAGRMNFKFEKTDVGALCEETRQLFERVVEEKSVRLFVQMPADPVEAFCDRNLVSEVIGNLVLNALKFTPEGGSIHLGAGVESGAVHVTIRDTGIGIPEDQLPKLFGRFFQVADKKAPGERIRGSGIGLAFCKEVVEAHHGRIWAESTASRGSTFHFTLPNTRVESS